MTTNEQITALQEQLQAIHAKLDALQKVEQSNGYFMPKVGGMYYTHGIEGKPSCINWMGDIVDFMHLLCGDVFPTKEAAEAADFEAIKHRIEVIATVNAIYQKHKVKEWELGMGEAFYRPSHSYIDNSFYIMASRSEINTPHKFPTTAEGEEAGNAFLDEVGQERYLEYCKLISQ